MALNPTDENTGQEGGLHASWEEWLADLLPDVLQPWPARVDVAGARDLVDRVVTDHPGLKVRLRTGGVGEPEMAGVYRAAQEEVLLPSAEEDLEFAARAGAHRISASGLERYDPVVIVSLLSHALVHASYEQGVEAPAERPPERAGAFAYLAGRYLGEGRRLEEALLLSMLGHGLTVRAFLEREWEIPEK